MTGLEVHKIAVFETNWRVTEAESILSALTEEELQLVLKKYFEQLKPGELEMMRRNHREVVDKEEKEIEAARKKQEKDQRVAEAKEIFSRTEITPEIIYTVLSYHYKGNEDEALRLLLEQPMDAYRRTLLPMAFLDYYDRLQLEKLRKETQIT